MSGIKNCFGTIEGLAISFNCVEGILLNQNSNRYTTIYGPFFAYFFVNWPRRQSEKKLLQVQLKAYSEAPTVPEGFKRVKTYMGIERSKVTFRGFFSF